jgi:hypothetical protein
LTSLSLVLTAPFGIEHCPYLDDVLVQAKGQDIELIVCDGSADFVDRSRPGLRHIPLAGRNLYGIVTEGIKHATKDWIVIFEDHGRPLPGYLEAYRDAALANPDIDLFSGGLDNLTSVSPWSFATFLPCLHVFWAPTGIDPGCATTANLMIRRSAILPAELTDEGGFVLRTLPRLIAAGRYKHCPNAVVDHVVDVTCAEAMKFQFGLAETGTFVRRDSLPPRPLAVQFLRDALGLVYYATVAPARAFWNLRRTSQFRPAVLARLVVLGLPTGAGILSADLKRLAKARPQQHPSPVAIEHPL